MRPVQSRRGSMVESVVNVAIGFLVAVLTQVAVFPAFGIHIPLSSNLGIAAVFTAISIVRSYCVRRIFEAGWRLPGRWF